ncbi:MAG: hypothetical protein AAGF47_10180 [Planctomycetota bacterium]
MNDQPNGQQNLPSLIDELEAAPAGAAHSKKPLSPAAKKKLRAVGGSALGLALGAGLIWGLLAILPTPMPDYETGDIDDIFSYTLLTADFNNLPVEERVDLIGQVIKRVESMGADDGSVLAAFAAGIMGEARDQLEENAATLVIDMWDVYAPGYASLPADADREQFLADAVVGMTRLFERLDGDPTERSDEELLARARRQAERDQEVFADPDRGPSAAGVGRFMSLMQREVGDRASPHQRARISELTRDMTRYLRGEPLGGGG